jgi:hypothetical protein
MQDLASTSYINISTGQGLVSLNDTCSTHAGVRPLNHSHLYVRCQVHRAALNLARKEKISILPSGIYGKFLTKGCENGQARF